MKTQCDCVQTNGSSRTYEEYFYLPFLVCSRDHVAHFTILIRISTDCRTSGAMQIIKETEDQPVRNIKPSRDTQSSLFPVSVRPRNPVALSVAPLKPPGPNGGFLSLAEDQPVQIMEASRDTHSSVPMFPLSVRPKIPVALL
jgi:hypothetical protein